MNSSAFLRMACLFNPFFGITSATTCGDGSTTVDTSGFTNPVVGPSTGGATSTCISGTVALPINATGLKILYDAPQDQAAVTESLVELFQADAAWIANVTAGGPAAIAGTYDIFVKLCLPNNLNPDGKNKIKTVQLLTHGATLDHTYWDIGPGYSYVDVASAAGYATLSYDQLGVGKSSHPDPIQTVQASSQVAVTHQLVALLRAAKLGGYSFDKVVGVGHSAGSTLTQGITTQFPHDFDAVVLSGTSASAASVAMTMAAFNFVNANADPAPQFKGLPAGFLTQQSAAGIQFAFYRFPNYDDDAFERQVANKQTNTLGVLLTLGGIVAPSTQFTGPVQIINGQHDLVFCGGNCLYPTDQDVVALETFYPAAAKGSQTYIAAGAGHAIAAHKSGPDSFKEMIQFLQANGL
ncbi:alpha/beta-hydrolase [Trichoderma citrinoviride]|uniref:Alpha/beta-hydrolase n=1 Tax=Trichoderma citrinoviride TaxID=58853 RepID=A0A2T4BCD4_9HYPO|nr:alpha/beta-hydrolase [Trichoderma citrinoviride]PTB66987.1 alpha/beta-hydrolase [Trichoderma citrinoviride]